MAAHELKTFPGLRAKSYDSPAHHFHSPGSPGALCVNCHMPARKYMGIDARRDHAIRIPRPDLTVKIGTPNVCSGCHADRTPEWAADAIARWYGPDRRHEAHYGEVLAAGRAGQRRGRGEPPEPGPGFLRARDRGPCCGVPPGARPTVELARMTRPAAPALSYTSKLVVVAATMAVGSVSVLL